jgi:deferrochelatase/peroxidase EfeB
VAYGSGLLLIAYQKDPRSGFIRMFERLVKFEMMRQLAIHTGSGVFACPPGVAPGQSIGAGLFV